jgi:hypothetical protein
VIFFGEPDRLDQLNNLFRISDKQGHPAHQSPYRSDAEGPRIVYRPFCGSRYITEPDAPTDKSTGQRDRDNGQYGVRGRRTLSDSASNQSDKSETAKSARFGGCVAAIEARIEPVFSDG